MAVNSVRNLQADALLEADENPFSLHGRMMDPRLPDRMMALQRKSAGGAPEAPMPWEEARRAEEEEAGREASSSKGVSFFIPNRPASGESPRPRSQADPDAAARATTAPTAAAEEPPGSPARVEQEHEAMFSAVRNQVGAEGALTLCFNPGKP
jgi:hypothetical protein